MQKRKGAVAVRIPTAVYAALVGSFLILCGNRAALAAEGSPHYADMQLKELMSLEVFSAASLLPTERTKAPGTAYSFDRADFARLGIRRIEDVLVFVPGIQLNQYRKRHRAIWSRGILDRYNDKFVLVVDGIRRQHLYYGHFSLGDEFPLEKVEKVEIVQGPASSLYGANAFAGIISITTRQFAADPAVSATLEVADNARGKSTVLYNTPRFQAFGSYLSQDAPFDQDRRSFIGGDTLQPLNEEYGNLFLKARPVDGLTLTLDYQRNETPFLFIPDTQDAYVDGESLTLAAAYEIGNLDDGKIEAKLYYTRDRGKEYEIERRSRRPAYREYQDGTIAGASVTGFKRLLDDHQLALGASWQHEQADDMDFVRYFHWRDGFYETPMTGSLLSDPAIGTDDFAVFAQDVWSIRPDLTLTLGARLDSYETFGDHTNYRASLVYTPSERQVWKLLYGTAIRTPTWREYLKVLEGTDFVAPTPKPESIESVELGWSYQWDNANLSVTLFHNEIEDYIHEVPTPDGADEYFTNSERPWTMAGVDMLARARLTPWLDLRLSAAYVDAQQSGEGDLPYVAPWSGSASLDYRYRQDHHAGISLIYNGDRSDTNEYPEDDSDSFVVVNLYGHGKLSPDLSYSFGIDNLFDEKIYDPAGDFGNQYNTERSRREIWARIEWKFDL